MSDRLAEERDKWRRVAKDLYDALLSAREDDTTKALDGYEQAVLSE